MAELDRLDQFSAFDTVPREEVTKAPLTLTWVDDKNGSETKASLGARPFARKCERTKRVAGRTVSIPILHQIDRRKSSGQTCGDSLR